MLARTSKVAEALRASSRSFASKAARKKRKLGELSSEVAILFRSWPEQLFG